MIPASLVTRLEKAATDTGFDQPLPPNGKWLAFRSSHAPITVWLGAVLEGQILVALSRADVSNALVDLGIPVTAPLPLGAAAARGVRDIGSVHDLLRRAYQLARTLPNELLHAFEERAAGLPRAPEAERLVVQRVGQDVFRDGLMEYWEGRCAVTGLAVPELLRASHIKPWADCETDAERLDVFNGLLLAPHLDAAFDRGFITLEDDGVVLVSHALPSDGKAVLGLGEGLRVTRLTSGHLGYLPWPREKVFKDPL
jgi:hypothetical protein